MKVWYEITPVDTFFFRGNEPMEAGQLVTTSLFPPPVTVIQGALRTAWLKERNIPFDQYHDGRVAPEVIKTIGPSGGASPFAVTAMLVKKSGMIYTAAPANWFVDPQKPVEHGKDYEGLEVCLAAPLDQRLAMRLGIAVSSPAIPLVTVHHSATPLAGGWVNLDLIGKKRAKLAIGDFLTAHEIYDMENRIGIAMDANRRVEEGKLYAAKHIRLREDVTFVIAIHQNIDLNPSGLMLLGGEQRLCKYVQIDPINLPTTTQESHAFVALAPVIAANVPLETVLCSQKPVVLAGWDLHEGFHKPTQSWFPAGTVFTQNINLSCVPLSQE